MAPVAVSERPRISVRNRYQRPLWQNTSRPIPGTVFTVHKTREVFNKKRMLALHKLAETGRLPVLFRVPKALAEKHNMPGKTTGKLWFSPLRRAFSDIVGRHYRLVFAKSGRGFIGLKGTGLSRKVLAKGDNFFLLENNRVPFGYNTERSPKTAHFAGGMIHSFAYKEAIMAEAINETFIRMRKRGDSAAKAAAFLPAFEPIVILEPIQIPVEASPDGTKSGAEKRGRKEALRDTNVPEKVSKEQAVLAYYCKTPYRIRDMKRMESKDLVTYLQKARSGEVPEKEMKWVDAAEHWRNMFEVHGYKLEVKGGNLVSYKRKGRNWEEVSFSEAKKDILQRFLRNFGAGIKTVHRELKGTFSTPEYTAIATKDVTLAGQIMDLDTVTLNIRDAEERKEQQHTDMINASSVVMSFVDNLFSDLGLREIAELKDSAKHQLRNIVIS